MIGQKLQEGRFEVLRRLADGWMGEEYVVYDANRGSELALRVLDQLDEETFTALKQKHSTLVNFGHPYLFYLFELFEEGGHWFLVTDLEEEFVEFWPLDNEKERPCLYRIQNIFGQITDALNFLHNNGTFHGRLDFSNVKILPEDEVRVADFGLVQREERRSELDGGILEDWRALGGLLYLSLTGEKASVGDGDSFSVSDVFQKVTNGRNVDENLATKLVELCVCLIQINSTVAMDGYTIAQNLKPLLDTSDPVEEGLKTEMNGCPHGSVRTELVEKLVQHYTFNRRFDDAFNLACEELGALGVKVPQKFNCFRFLWLAFLNQISLKRGQMGEALNMPSLKNEKSGSVLRIMRCMLKPAFCIQHKLGWLLLLEAVWLGLRNGRTSDSRVLFAMYGMVFRGGIKEDWAFGEEMQRVITQLDTNDSDSRCIAEVQYLAGMHGTCWIHPAEEGEVFLRKAYKSGRINGDLHTARLAAVGIVMSQWMRGVRLPELWELTESFLPFVKESELEELPAVLGLVRQVILCYQRKTPHVDFLDSDDFDEGQYLGDMVGFQYRHLAQFSYVFLANFCAAHGRLVASKIHAHLSKENIQMESSPGMLLYAEHFYQEVLSNGCDQKFGKVETFLTKALNKFQNWASLCPENFKAKQEMIFAEDYLKMGRHSDAESNYLRAAEIAQKYDNYLVRAWAFERISTLPNGEKYLDARTQAWSDYGAISLASRKGKTF